MYQNHDKSRGRMCHETLGESWRESGIEQLIPIGSILHRQTINSEYSSDDPKRSPPVLCGCKKTVSPHVAMFASPNQGWTGRGRTDFAGCKTEQREGQ